LSLPRRSRLKLAFRLLFNFLYLFQELLAPQDINFSGQFLPKLAQLFGAHEVLAGRVNRRHLGPIYFIASAPACAAAFWRCQLTVAPMP
jgi:hypothetical protein